RVAGRGRALARAWPGPARGRRPPRTDGCGAEVRAGDLLLDDALEGVAQLHGFRCGALDDQPASPFERDPHDDAAALLHDLPRTATGARTHSSHRAPLMWSRPSVAP